MVAFCNAENENLSGAGTPRSLALYRTRSAAVYGIQAHPIDIEVDMYGNGNARDFVMVGMPDTAVRESRERIKSSLLNSGFGYPNKSVTINLAPANVRKEGAGFDLPMALGILGAMGAVSSSDQFLFAGELSLDGSLRPVRGALSIAACARALGIRNLVVPAENAAEASVTEGVSVYGLRHLAEVVGLMKEPHHFTPASQSPICRPVSEQAEADFGDVRGQMTAKRALEVAAAGNHNVLTLSPITRTVSPLFSMQTFGERHEHLTCNERVACSIQVAGSISFQRLSVRRQVGL